MKKRVISAIIMLIIAVPILLIGGNIFNLFIYFISILALKEFIELKANKKELPFFITFISYISLTLIELSRISKAGMIFEVDYRVISGLFLLLLIPTVIYHDKKVYSVKDAFYLVGSIFFLGSSFSLFMTLRTISLEIIIYLLLVATMTDCYAYIVGSLIGRHKLLEEVSPKKTWEGSIGGTFFGVLIPSIYYITVINSNVPIYAIILITLFLSIIGQFGDLFFSTIKRYFGKKDFSNLIPGHGGILDRFDSIIFIALAFIFFVEII